MKKPLLTTQPDAIVARLNELNEDKVELSSVGKINEMTDEELDGLRCGDVVVKKTGNQRHAYKVTYKSPTGICLTYHDASVIETQSYDLVEGHWVYNSEDKTPNLLDVATKQDIEGGTIENAKPIYCHPITIRNNTLGLMLTCLIFNNDKTTFTLATFKKWIDDTQAAIEDNLRIMTSGSYTNNTKEVIASYLYKGIDLKYGIAGRFADSSSSDFKEFSTFDGIFPPATTELFDGVNKIN